MKIGLNEAKRQDWDQVKSWNYKLKHIKDYQSVVYAELDGDHGEVHTNDLERIYFIVSGKGEFKFNNQIFVAKKGDVITVPPKTKYNYKPLGKKSLKILLFMELWDN
jgi:mannose-6-phosphate isomerase-like protein (cupin superfamily)